jgi:hypothetical protein
MSHRLPLYLFLGWSLVQAVWLVIAIRQGKAMPQMRLAAAKVSAPDDDMSQEQMAKGFLWISVIWFIVVAVVSAACYAWALEGSGFAFFLFMAIAGWSAYQAATHPIAMRRMYPGTIGWQDWLAAAISTAVWVLLLATLAEAWMRRAA